MLDRTYGFHGSSLLVSFSFKVLFPLCGRYVLSARWPIISADNPVVYSVNKHVRVAGKSENYTLGRKVVREKWTVVQKAKL